MTRGASFEAALADAQRLGYAEPDPTMDISGADAAEKLTILIRLFGRLLVDPDVDPARRASTAVEGERHRRGRGVRRRHPSGVPRASWQGAVDPRASSVRRSSAARIRWRASPASPTAS